MTVPEKCPKFFKADVEDAAHVLTSKFVEANKLVHAVDKLGRKVLTDLWV